MKWLENSPLQRKITWVTMCVALSTLFIALIALSMLESHEFRRSFERELKSIAGITGGNSIAALEFLDEDTARRTLGVLREDPRILAAVLYDANHKEFARYISDETSNNDSISHLPSGIMVSEPIFHEEEQIGSIQVIGSRREISSRLLDYGVVSVFIALLSTLAAYLLSRRLRNIISTPILQLAETARKVSQSGDYSLRVRKESNDETGELVAQFNRMLGAVEKASADLQASENQLRTITDSLPVLISYVDSEVRYQFTNAAYYSWFRKKPEELKGQFLRDVLGEQAFAAVEPYLKMAFSGQSVQYETEIFYPETGRRYISSSLIPDFRDGKHVQGVFSLVLDITDRKNAEAERERLLVSERTARNEAERASMLKDEFLATLSHELRTPLNAIVGWAQILKRDSKSPERTAEGIGVIERNARMQAKLISDLLDLSHITSGKLSLDMQPVHIEKVIHAAIDAVSVSAKSKQIQVKGNISPDVRLVFGDADRLEQVISNLLTNSIKFTPNNGEVNVDLNMSGPNWIEIIVSDTGRGIAPDFLPYVFERFRQADSSVTRKTGGLGIGLALVKQLVEYHGGTVKAQSEGDNKGAKFTIHLPVYRGSGEANPETKLHHHDLSGLRVLVVDDEPDAIGVVKRMLEESGARVLVADGALRALEVLRSERPHIVLSDIGMPEYDGFHFIQRVRELDTESGGETPAIALTALARAEDRQKALLAGFQAHLAKPVEYMDLMTTITRFSPRAVFKN